jgi:hypothetical protein
MPSISQVFVARHHELIKIARGMPGTVHRKRNWRNRLSEMVEFGALAVTKLAPCTACGPALTVVEKIKNWRLDAVQNRVGTIVRP